MNSYLQLFSFFISFIYGAIFFLLTRLNFYFIEKLSNHLKMFITFVFVIDIVIIYSLIMYKVNNGNLHIYFVCMVLIGFLTAYLTKIDNIIKNFINSIVKKCKKDKIIS